MTTPLQEFLTASEAAAELELDVSRILQLCRQGRLGYSTAKFGKQWVITRDEIKKYREKGPKKPGRPVNEE